MVLARLFVQSFFRIQLFSWNLSLRRVNLDQISARSVEVAEVL